MKYFKFAQISAETGVSWAIAQPVSGPSWPPIPGLDLDRSIQLAHSPVYYIAPVADEAVADPDNHVFELTTAEYAEELKVHVMHQLNQEKDSIYEQEMRFRESIFSKYHDTATIAGVYKYEQAKQLLADPGAAAADVRAEAIVRGITAEAMATRIVENHESFRAKEAKIAGIRGKILDRLNNYTFDMLDPASSHDEFMSTEVIGTETHQVLEDDQMVEKQFNVVVDKYSLSLETRFKYE